MPTRETRVALLAALAVAAALVGCTEDQDRVVWAPESSPYDPSGWNQRPSAIVVGNSQCTVYPSRLRWQSWGGDEARAKGVVLDPSRGTGESCAEQATSAGEHEATVILDRMQRCRGRWIYSHLTWTWDDYRNGVTFPLQCETQREAT